MHIANIHEAKTHLSKLLEKAMNGEEVIIAKAGKKLVTLTPYVEKPLPKRKPGAWKGKVWMAPDFDAVDEEIADLILNGTPEDPLNHGD